MANNNGRIYIDTSSTPNVGISVGDLQTVLGRGEGDIGLLCGDVQWDNTQNPAVLVDAGAIKPMAKYKPVRHSSLATLTDVQRASVRYGFAISSPPQLTLSQNNPQNDWVYLKPRGKGAGSGGADEWFRIMDFNGYSHGACHPLVVSVGQLVYDAASPILLFGNEKSNAIRTDGMTWVANQSLSLEELLESATDYYAHHIAFLLIDTYDNEKNLIVMRKTMSEFVSDDYASYIFYIYATTTTESGVTYPGVPLLASGRSGHTFRVIACLMAGNAPSSQDPEGYFVYTSTSTPAVSTLTAYSLGFETGSDRTDVELASGAFKMDGVTISLHASCVDMDIEMQSQIDGLTYHAFKMVVRGEFSTMGVPPYSGTEMMVSGTMSLYDGGGFRFGQSPSSGDNPLDTYFVASLASRTAGQDKSIFSASSDQYLWVLKNQGTLVPNSVTVSATIDYPVDNPVVATPVTVNVPPSSQ